MLRNKTVAFLLTFFMGLFFGFANYAFASTDRLEGYAWSSNVGWISFSCSNANSCGSSNYGVVIDQSSGVLSGQAWNSNIGWISFNAEDVAGCPSVPCAPKLVGGIGSGWARVVPVDPESGWEAWIHLAGPGYGVTQSATELKGFSWSDDVVGWMNWNPSIGPGVHRVPSSVLSTGVLGGGPNSNVRIGTDVCTSASCLYSHQTSDIVALVASPAPGYTFSNWTGLNASECPQLSATTCDGILLSSDKEIKASFRTSVCPSDGPGNCPACNDGVDNDADTKIDFPADTNCQSRTGPSEAITAAACDNCIDDDGDGRIDWVNDTGCKDQTDNNEINAILTASTSDTGGASGRVVSDPAGINCKPNCNKEYISDDEVKLTALPSNTSSNFWRWSGACLGTNPVCQLVMTISRTAVAHFGATVAPSCPRDGPGACPECNDGDDNDDDGRIDFPADQQCTSRIDPTEGTSNRECPGDGPGACPVCNDGADNDEDGLVDYSNDPECLGDPEGESEDGGDVNCPADGPGVCPQCNDGVDNADPEDLIADYPIDPGCYSRADNNEIDPVIIGNCPTDGPGICPRCNDGIDNDEDGLIDWFGWDSDKDEVREIKRDPSCQGEPNKNTEAGGVIIKEI